MGFQSLQNRCTETVTFEKVKDKLYSIATCESPQRRQSLISPKRARADAELQAFLEGVAEDGIGFLDFPEFLRLMRKVQDADWNGISAAAAAVVEAELHHNRELKTSRLRPRTTLLLTVVERRAM